MKTVLKLTCLFYLILFSNLSFGVKDNSNFAKIYPKTIPAATGSIVEVNDYAKIAACNKWKDYFRFTKINTVFTFEIDPENTIFCNPSAGANQVLTMEVAYTGIPFNQSTGALLSPVAGTFTLKLIYNPISGKLETKKSTKILENFVKVTYNYGFKVDGVAYGAQCSPSVVFSIENQVDRNYKINTDFYNSISANTISVPTSDLNVENCQNKTTITINNNLITTGNCNDNTYFMHDIPEFYELEYFFVDFDIRKQSGSTLSTFDYAYFKNNSTRVQLKSNTFDIPCIYPKGYIVYRVRMVAYDMLNPSKLVYSKWSMPDEPYPDLILYKFNDVSGSDDNTTGLTYENTNYKCGFMVRGHEPQKNWQYSIAFAEEAKNKGVISYFDGSLRNRQTITRMNAENNTIVGQTIYDWYGRPAISVLPVPTDPGTQNDYCFKPNFNIAERADPQLNKQYDWTDFDQDIEGQNCTWKAANAMKNSSGASKYYSQNNAGLNVVASLQQSMFIPNAYNYPFAQTEFTPDASNRPSRQGGLGKTHQLFGSFVGGGVQQGRFTEFSYEVPSQEELFLLFGNDIGDHKYYRKNITTDPNGQSSVTYIDPDGKTIATALLGDPANSANLEELNSSNDGLEIKTYLPSSPKSVNGVIPNQLLSSFTKVFTEGQEITINYGFTTKTYLDACNNNVCYDCIYDLNISIVNECGVEFFPEPRSQTVGTIEPFDLECDGEFTFTAFSPDPQAIYLPKGTYTIKKTLTVNQDAFEFYRDQYMADESCVLPLEDFIVEEYQKIDYTDCFRTCEVCKDDVVKIQEEIDDLIAERSALDPNGPNYATLFAGLNERIEEEEENKVDMEEECKGICGELTECDVLLEQIKLDMMPGGDYAQYLKQDKLENGEVEEISDPAYLGYIYRSNGGVYYFQNPKNTSGTPTPYKNKDGSDAYIQIKCTGSGTFSPPVISAATIYDLNKVALSNSSIAISGNMYLVKPHQLYSYRDFIDVFKEEWVEQLIHYHPELCMWSKCKTFEESYKYDMDMMNTEDPAEAITKGFLNPLSTASGNQGFEFDNNGNRTLTHLNFPSYSSPYSNDPFINYTSNPNLKQDLLNLMYNYKDNNGVNTGYTIWEIYYLYLQNMGIENSSCLSGEGWEYFRTLYINAKRNVLAAYYDYDYPNNWCVLNIDQTLQNNPTIKRKFFYRQSDRNSKMPVSPTSSSYNADMNAHVAVQCNENCQLVVDVWMQKLEGCNTLTNVISNPSLMLDLRVALMSVCERSCNAEYNMGGQKVFPENWSSTLPNTTKEAIFKVLGMILPDVCDDILLSFPTTYDDDPNSTDDADADTCACNPFSYSPVKRIGCPEETLPIPPPLTPDEEESLTRLNNCICPLEDDALRRELSSRESIPENKKCKDCINCDELALALYNTLIRPDTDGSPTQNDPVITVETRLLFKETNPPPSATYVELDIDDIDFTDAVIQKIIEAYFNKYFGFSLTYAEYLEMAKKCTGSTSTNDNEIWQEYYGKARSIPDYKKLGVNHPKSAPHEETVETVTCGCDKLFEAEKLVAEGKYPTTILALQHLIGKPIQLSALELQDISNLCCTAVAIQSNYYWPPNLPPPVPVEDWYNNATANVCTTATNYRPGNWGNEQREYFRDILDQTPIDPAALATLLLIKEKLSPCKDNYFTPCPKLCNKPRLFITEYTDPCIELLETFALLNAKQKYITYLKEKEENFKLNYYAKCMTAQENMPFSYQLAQHHYTLYYYDQAGNLTKTVPPAGVDIQHWFDTKEIDAGAPVPQDLCDARIAACYAHKGNPGANPYTVPNHRLITQYQYNTLNQLSVQITPDAGKSEFWYDKLGRLVVSRNSKQLAEENYSYTVYNTLGLILEVGQINIPSTATQMDHQLAADPDLLEGFLTLNINYNKTQVTRTVYNKQYIPATEAKFSNGRQSNLRNRVVSIFIEAERGSLRNPGQYQHAVHYSYDIHGNVKEMVQEVSELDRFGKRWTNITYEYDLISGNVNQVNYQPGKLDAYHHRYTYDGDNRLVQVQTSQEGRVWETDARYQYYQHGPLARTELGQEQVQGMDYAYTLSGWLKAVNGDILKTENDMGKDGTNLIPVLDHSYFARDIFGYTLGYYTSDYIAIGIGNSQYKPMQIKRYDTNIPSDMARTTKDLFNGNISYMTIALPDFATFANGTAFNPKPVANTFRYDQLNRITKARFFDETNVNPLGETLWKANPTPKTGEDAYYSTYQYDANGNITHLTRKNGSNALMDDLTYRYNNVDASNSGKGKYDNKLYHVNDASSTSSSAEIKDQGSYTMTSNTNYEYDKIGNLIKDKSEEIETIEWNVYGKISKIIRDRTGSPVCTKPDLEFVYDGTGNRLIKKVKPWNSGSNSLEPAAKWQYTYYLRDAQGNTMAVYSSANDTTYRLNEHHIYGSSRLGMQTYRGGDNVTGKHLIKNTNLVQRVPPDSMIYIVRGLIYYELSNHLGNVQATVSDRKLVVLVAGSTMDIDYYLPDVQSMTDYYPFGMVINGRTFMAGSGYRYSFNGKEHDDEIEGEGNSIAFEARIYDPRLGRFLSTDPLEWKYAYQSTYVFAANNPTALVDILGMGAGDPPSTLYHNTEAGKDIVTKGFNATTNGKYSNYNWFSTSSNAPGTGKTGTGVTLQVEGIDVSKAQTITKAQTTGWRTEAMKELGYTDDALKALQKSDPKAYGQAMSKINGSLYSKVGAYMDKMKQTAYFLEKDGTYAVSDVLANKGTITRAGGSASAVKALNGLKWAKRTLIVVAVGADIYEIYNSENKARTITKKVGGWAGAWAASSITGAGLTATGIDFTGPWGWVAHGALTLGAGVGGYFGGEYFTETVYDVIRNKGVKPGMK